MQLRFRRTLSPVAVAVVLLAMVVTGSAAQSDKPISGVHVQGTSNTQMQWKNVGPDTLVYAQNPDFNGAYSSQNDTNSLGVFAQVYDNFKLNSATNLTSVEWVGSYFNPPQQGNITAWTLQVYSDNNGQPGSVLYSEHVNGTAGETFLQNDNVGDPTYLYGLNVNFSAAANTQYWLSVYPDLGFPPQWGWETSSQGDHVSYQDFFGTRSQLAADEAFALFTSSATTPEPGTLALLGTGLLGLAGTIRRKLF